MKTMQHLKNMMLDKDSLKLINDLKEHQAYEQDDADALDCVVGNIEVSGKLVKLGSDVTADLEIDKTYQGHNDCMTIIGGLDSCRLLGGTKYFAKLIMNPICDRQTLETRKAVLQSLKCKLSDNNADLKLSSMRACEQDVLWMYRRTTNELDSLYDIVYLTSLPFRPCNASSYMLTGYNVYRIAVSPVIGCLSPITMIVMPYILLQTMGLRIPITKYLRMLMYMVFTTTGSSYGYVSLAFTIFMYFQNVLNSVELAKTSYTICRIVTNRMNNVVNFFQLANELLSTLWDDSMSSFFRKTYQHDRNTSSFDGSTKLQFSITNNFGDQLQSFKRFDKDLHRSNINNIYILDALCCIDRLSGQHCLATYVDQSSSFVLKGVFHPCIKEPVLNDLSMGTAENIATNIILTSPNGSGKSVLIKSIMISIMLAQSIIVTCAMSCVLSPFSYISSQINIPDCKGKESLFEAEMNRSKNHLDAISDLKDREFSLICTDEMFNSTSAIEGVAAAYAVLEKMSKSTNSLNIVSTHYLYLTKLTSENPRAFANYKINCVKLKNGTIKYPHKLTKGISSQHIALDLLLQNGFDPALVNSAKKIVETLTKKKKRVQIDA